MAIEIDTRGLKFSLIVNIGTNWDTALIAF